MDEDYNNFKTSYITKWMEHLIFLPRVRCFELDYYCFCTHYYEWMSKATKKAPENIIYA